jgi:hypothetical protein
MKNLNQESVISGTEIQDFQMSYNSVNHYINMFGYHPTLQKYYYVSNDLNKSPFSLSNASAHTYPEICNYVIASL